MHVDVRQRAVTQRGMLRPSACEHAVSVNAAIEISVLDYNVAVRQRIVRTQCVCERGLTVIDHPRSVSVYNFGSVCMSVYV